MDIYLFEFSPANPFRNVKFLLKPVDVTMRDYRDRVELIIQDRSAEKTVPENYYSAILCFENKVDHYKYTYFILSKAKVEVLPDTEGIKIISMPYFGKTIGARVLSDTYYDFTEVDILELKGGDANSG